MGNTIYMVYYFIISLFITGSAFAVEKTETVNALRNAQGGGGQGV